MRAMVRFLLIAVGLFAATTFAARPANFGLTGGDGGSGRTPAVQDLFKSGPGAAPKPTPNAAPQMNDPGPQPAPAVAPAGTVKLAYSGHAHADGRRAQVDFTISAGGKVTGTIAIQSICEQNVHLGGADLTFAGVLTGAWESRTAAIDGTWRGTEHFCGTDSPNNGTFKFFRNEEDPGHPILHLRLIGKNGRYGWDFPPTDRIYATASPGAGSGTAASGSDGINAPVAGDGSTAGNEPGTPPTGKDKTDKPKTEGQTADEPDPESVTGIVVMPAEVPIIAGQKAALPVVYAIVGDTADKIPVSVDKIEWTTPRGLSITNGEFEVPSRALEGDRLTFKVRVKLSLTKTFDGGGVVHVVGERLGSISGSAHFYYRYPDYRGDPRRPLRATVELRLSPGGGPERRTTTGPDGRYRFEGLQKGTYWVVVTGFQADPFPPGYRLKVPNGPWVGYWTTIPEYKSAFNPDPTTAKWDFTSVSTEIALVGPDYGVHHNAVTGRVTYHGQGVAGVTVMANRVGADGGQKSATSSSDGSYVLDTEGMQPGTYWLRAQKFVVAQWAGPDDLLDTASARDERSVLFIVPFFATDELSIDIEVLTRNEIFGGERTPEQPVGLP